ncbi:MAG: hypothetical protein AAF518_21700 [Spirochaetota bacterium]
MEAKYTYKQSRAIAEYYYDRYILGSDKPTPNQEGVTYTADADGDYWIFYITTQENLEQEVPIEELSGVAVIAVSRVDGSIRVDSK